MNINFGVEPVHAKHFTHGQTYNVINRSKDLTKYQGHSFIHIL